MRIFLFLPLWISLAGLNVARAAHDEPPQVTLQLKAAIEQVEKKIPEMELWQKKIFDEEVVPQYQRFIRDYRPSAGGLNVDVDQATIQDYIRFYAPKALNKPDPKVMVLLKAESSCGKCTASLDGIKKLLKARLERRGFVVVWLSADELRDQSISGKELNDHVMEMAAKKGAPGAFTFQWNLMPVDDADSTHADENHYQILSYFQIKDLPKIVGQTELLDTDHFEVAAARLITDAFTELGKKSGVAAPGSVVADREEFTIEVSGIREFPVYTKLKAHLTERLKDFATFEERRISRGQVIFALFTKKPLSEIRGLLEGPVGDRKLALISATDKAIQMEIR